MAGRCLGAGRAEGRDAPTSGDWQARGRGVRAARPSRSCLLRGARPDRFVCMGRGPIDPERCGHNVAVTQRGEGARRARCLICGTVGPERPTSEEAAEALKERGGERGR